MTLQGLHRTQQAPLLGVSVMESLRRPRETWARVPDAPVGEVVMCEHQGLQGENITFSYEA